MMRYLTPSTRRRSAQSARTSGSARLKLAARPRIGNDDHAVRILDLLIAIPAFELVAAHLEVEERDRSLDRGHVDTCRETDRRRAATGSSSRRASSCPP